MNYGMQTEHAPLIITIILIIKKASTSDIEIKLGTQYLIQI